MISSSLINACSLVRPEGGYSKQEEEEEEKSIYMCAKCVLITEKCHFK
jgi:hypothetical protein